MTRSDHWHVERGVPISLIVTIIAWALLQTATAGWYAAAMDKRVEAVEKAQASEQLLVYPQGERLTRLEEKVVAVQAGVARIEALLQPPGGARLPR